MAVSWGIKSANEVLDRSYNWAGRLNGAEIVTASLTVDCGTVVLSSVANTADGISATISGGSDCEEALIRSTVVTDADETLEETFTVSVRRPVRLGLGPSTSTKRQLIEMAFEECALAGYEFDSTPEELFQMLRRLDAIMARWLADGIDLGYNAPATFGGGDLDDYSGIPDGAVDGAVLELALAKAPTMGKSLSPETRARRSAGLATVRAMTATIPGLDFPNGTLMGAGRRPWGNRYPYYYRGSRCC